MNANSFSEDDLFQVDSSLDVAHTTEVIELEEPEGVDPTWTGPRCEKCAAPLRGSQMEICQSCGWYASLGAFVELDDAWEQATATGSGVAAKTPQSFCEVWMSLLPWYGWLTIANVLAVLAESGLVRWWFADSSARTTWSLAQLALGAVVFAVCHIINYLSLASDNSDTGLLDFIVKPLGIWLHAARKLPRNLVFFSAGLVGLAAVIGSLAIIGGIPYERLLDWGIKERAKPNLMAAAMEQAAKHAKDDDLTMEEAIEELAGNAGVEDLDLEGDDTQPEPKERQEIDCLILGFRADEDGYVRTLILAAEFDGRLVYAGRVEPRLEPDDNHILLKNLRGARITQPIVPIQLQAEWVRPLYTCRVSYTDRGGDGRLDEIEWRKLLGKVKLGRRQH